MEIATAKTVPLGSALTAAEPLLPSASGRYEHSTDKLDAFTAATADQDESWGQTVSLQRNAAKTAAMLVERHLAPAKGESDVGWKMKAKAIGEDESGQVRLVLGIETRDAKPAHNQATDGSDSINAAPITPTTATVEFCAEKRTCER